MQPTNSYSFVIIRRVGYITLGMSTGWVAPFPLLQELIQIQRIYREIRRSIPHKTSKWVSADLLDLSWLSMVWNSNMQLLPLKIHQNILLQKENLFFFCGKSQHCLHIPLLVGSWDIYSQLKDLRGRQAIYSVYCPPFFKPEDAPDEAFSLQRWLVYTGNCFSDMIMLLFRVSVIPLHNWLKMPFPIDKASRRWHRAGATSQPVIRWASKPNI